MITLYSYLAGENLARLFQIAGYNVPEERINEGLKLILAGTLPGDMNKNGVYDTGDATIILRMVVGLEKPNLLGDMNENGIIDTGDATIVLRRVVSLE
jgi:hypothetical protein